MRPKRFTAFMPTPQEESQEDRRRTQALEAALLLLLLRKRRQARNGDELRDVVRVLVSHGRTAARSIGREGLARTLGIAVAASPDAAAYDVTRAARLAENHVLQVQQAAVKAAASGETSPWKAAVEQTTFRAETLAATEVYRAVSEERLRVADEIVATTELDLWKTWNAELDACPICRLLDGETVRVGDVFSIGGEPGTVHPHCRCWVEVHPGPVAPANDITPPARPLAEPRERTRPASPPAKPPAPPAPPVPPSGGGGPPKPPGHSFEAWKEAGFKFPGNKLSEREYHANFQRDAEALFGKPLDVESAKRILGVDRVPGTGTLRAFWLRGEGINLEAEYFSDAIGEVARIDRTFTKTDEGIRAYHGYFRVAKDLQGQGIGKSVLRDQLLEYAELGVKRVELDAAWVGRYTWSNMGFDVETAGALDYVKDRFIAHLWDVDILEGRASLVDQVNAATRMHDLARVHLGEVEWGKSFLAGADENWMIHMGMTLEPGNLAYETALEYVGLKP